ncbi:LysR substrate-binding domain-containing protein [Pseudomonas sp. F1_0610]|uniref:LysR substrate-binding domain-containing protein n=1 Tax=Pseudomonas sp. F1_0610 TaxID=3114284 RepID=UPI0039C28880
MDLLNLEIFQTVAQQRSITKTAQLLNKAQSNISTRVQQLEKQLDAQLFVRDKKQLELTAQGVTFLHYSQRILMLAEEAKQALHPHNPSGKLTIGSMESTVASRLPKVLAQYQQLWDKVELQVTTAPSLQLLQEVVDYRLDCAFLALDQHKLPAGLGAQMVFHEELLLIVPERYKDLALSTLPIRRLACFRQGCSYRRFAQRQLPYDLILQEVGSYHAIIACVAAGTCIGVLPRSVLELQSHNPGVFPHPLGLLDTYFIWRENNTSRALKQLRKQLFS